MHRFRRESAAPEQLAVAPVKPMLTTRRSRRPPTGRIPTRREREPGGFARPPNTHLMRLDCPDCIRPPEQTNTSTSGKNEMAVTVARSGAQPPAPGWLVNDLGGRIQAVAGTVQQLHKQPDATELTFAGQLLPWVMQPWRTLPQAARDSVAAQRGRVLQTLATHSSSSRSAPAERRATSLRPPPVKFVTSSGSTPIHRST
jgi:hypothetical protein